ncbi:uncharacterized protein KRP23_11308 [Globisporangium polare]
MFLSALNATGMQSPATPAPSASNAAAEYWRQHALVKAQHQGDVVKVHVAFKKHVDHMKQHSNNPAQKHKLRYLLSYVQLCASVLSEDQRTHQPRKIEELDTVCKYIVKIVNPYVKKLHTETLKRQPLQTSNARLGSPAAPLGIVTFSAAAYWYQHAALKAKYQSGVNQVLGAFMSYMDRKKDAQEESASEMKLRVLLRCVQHCASVLGEDRTTHAPRESQELDKVLQYIVKIVDPYLKKLRVEAGKRAAVLNMQLSSSDAGHAGSQGEDSDDLADLLVLFGAL